MARFHANGQPPHRRRVDGALGLDFLAAAELTGFSELALRARVRRGIIPYRRAQSAGKTGRGRVLFLRAELEAWLTQQAGVTLEQARANEARRESP